MIISEIKQALSTFFNQQYKVNNSYIAFLLHSTQFILFYTTFGNETFGMQQRIIGRKDVVCFPSFGLEYVRVKIDSGAYSSSMHCSLIELIEQKGKPTLKVIFLDASYPGYTGEVLYFDTFTTKSVKSSNGMSQERYFIKGTVRLFNEEIQTVFSLTQRTGLRNPILLGRKLLNKRFLIDSSKTNCSQKTELENPQSH